MKLSRKRSRRPFIILLIAVIAAAVVAYFLLSPQWSNRAEVQKGTSDNEVNYAAPSEEEINAGSNIKGDKYNEQDKNTADTSVSSPIKISQAEQIGNVVRVRTIIDTVTSSGSCTVKIRHPDGEYKHTVGIQALSDYSTCKGFDIPVSSLSPGNNFITAEYSTNGNVSRDTTSLEISQ